MHIHIHVHIHVHIHTYICIHMYVYGAADSATYAHGQARLSNASSGYDSVFDRAILPRGREISFGVNFCIGRFVSKSGT